MIVLVFLISNLIPIHMVFSVQVLYSSRNGQRGTRITYRVPYLELDLLSLDVDHAGSEFDPNSEVVHRLKSFVSELK